MSSVEIRRAFYGDLPVVVFKEIQTESNRNSLLVTDSVQTLYRPCTDFVVQNVDRLDTEGFDARLAQTNHLSISALP